MGEASHLPQFVADLFGEVLGYRGDVDSPAAYTLAREYVNPVDGKCADAVIGRFAPDQPRRPVMVVEGKSPLDPLERPWAGRKKSAVEQAYLYAVNLSCDWIVVTNMAETRLYNKRADMRAFERFETRRLANAPHTLARFVFVLGRIRCWSRGAAAGLTGCWRTRNARAATCRRSSIKIIRKSVTPCWTRCGSKTRR